MHRQLAYQSLVYVDKEILLYIDTLQMFANIQNILFVI